jgi:hypothetical protein
MEKGILPAEHADTANFTLHSHSLFQRTGKSLAQKQVVANVF